MSVIDREGSIEMNVTIIGTGNMAGGIATRLLAGGHDVTVLGTEADKAKELAGELSDSGGSVGSGTTSDPIEGEVVVLAVPYEAAAPLVQEYGEGLSGKVVVDITNPVDWESMDGLVTPPDSSAAEEIQKSAPEGARIVKAFNTTFAATLVDSQVAAHPLDVFVAGDDEEAKETVARLVRDGGLVAIDVGALRRARELERLGFLGITLQEPLGLDFQSTWKLVN
ncbi:MAG: NADPH-dependent F420 reductase [Rubrobacteraceae bacterium]